MSGMATAPSSGTATLDLFLSGQAFEVALNNVRARAHEQGEAGPGASRAAHAAGARGPVTPTVIVPPGPPVGRPPGATTTASALVEAKRLPAGESASGQRLAAGMAIASTPSMDEAACDGALAANDLRGDDTHGDTAPEIDHGSGVGTQTEGVAQFEVEHVGLTDAAGAQAAAAGHVVDIVTADDVVSPDHADPGAEINAGGLRDAHVVQHASAESETCTTQDDVASLAPTPADPAALLGGPLVISLVTASAPTGAAQRAFLVSVKAHADAGAPVCASFTVGNWRDAGEICQALSGVLGTALDEYLATVPARAARSALPSAQAKASPKVAAQRPDAGAKVSRVANTQPASAGGPAGAKMAKAILPRPRTAPGPDVLRLF